MMDGLVPIMILVLIMVGITAGLMWAIFHASVRWNLPRLLAFLLLCFPPAGFLYLLDIVLRMPLPG